MHANVLQKACIRCGLCPALCPEVFSLPGDGGSAQAVADEIPAELQPDAMAAAESCPTGAIELR